MKVFEYMWLPFKLIPKEIVDQYNLQDKVTSGGLLYIKIRKWCILSYEKLTDHLALSGYHPTPLTHGLWTQKTRKIKFSLVIDDFRIKYEDKANAKHLLQTLHKK